MKLKYSIVEIKNMHPKIFNKGIYGINAYKPQPDDIEDYMFVDDGEGWFINLNRRTKFYLIPHKTYLRDINNNINLILSSIIEDNDKAGKIEVDDDGEIFIYLNTLDYKKVFKEAKQLHKLGVEICNNNEDEYRWGFFMPDHCIEDSLLLDLLNDPRVYTKDMKKLLKIKIM